MTPTQAMDRPARDFWMDARIRAAGVWWERQQRERAQESHTSAGAADPAEKEDLVDAQESRADQRESMDGQPTLEDQLDAIDTGRDGSTGRSDGSTPDEGRWSGR